MTTLCELLLEPNNEKKKMSIIPSFNDKVRQGYGDQKYYELCSRGLTHLLGMTLQKRYGDNPEELEKAMQTVWEDLHIAAKMQKTADNTAEIGSEIMKNRRSN